MVERRHCTNIRDVRRIKGAETESGNFLVRAKIRLKLRAV